jgi:hypothetical protein
MPCALEVVWQTKYVPLLLEEDAEDDRVDELLPHEIHARTLETVSSSTACRIDLFTFVSCCVCRN